MIAYRRWLGRALIGLVAMALLMWVFGPYEPVETDVSFEPRKFGEGVQVYFESVESVYDDLKEGVGKRVIWAGQAERRTPISVLFVHGFSASSEEIRPVPDRVAEALGANLVFTRLTGHGRTGDAMAEASAGDWMRDAAEALAAAQAVGDEVIVISVSTGGTLVALAMLDEAMREKVKGAVFISPNFGVNDPVAPLLTMPAARYLLPLVAGHERAWTAANELQERYWTTRYPTVAVFPMAALVKEAVSRDYSAVSVPALFHYSEKDQVVDPAKTAAFIEGWGGDVRVELLPEGAQVEESHHVLAGDIVAPARTEAAVQMILDWVEGL